jgi:hypothetical protein
MWIGAGMLIRRGRAHPSRGREGTAGVALAHGNGWERRDEWTTSVRAVCGPYLPVEGGEKVGRWCV